MITVCGEFEEDKKKKRIVLFPSVVTHDIAGLARQHYLFAINSLESVVNNNYYYMVTTIYITITNTTTTTTDLSLRIKMSYHFTFKIKLRDDLLKSVLPLISA